MGAKLPGSIVSGEVHGMRPNTASVDHGDFGLGEAARAAGAWVEAKDAQDNRAAQDALLEARQSFDPETAQAEQSYDGLEGGYALDRTSQYDRLTAAARAKLPDGALQRYDRLVAEDRLQVSTRASGVEARAAQVWVDRAREADRTARVIGSATSFKVETADKTRTAFAEGDPAAPGFADERLADFDGRMAATLEAASEEDRPYLQTQLANQRADLQSAVAAGSRALLDLRVNEQVKGSLTALQNAVTADPKFLPQALGQLETVLSVMPADLREKMRPAAISDLTAASLSAMANGEDWSGVDKALEDPKVKAQLSADAYARLRGRTTQVLTSQQRAMAQQSFEQRLASEEASIRETGQGTGLDVASEAMRAFGPVEGPVRAKALARALTDAKDVYDLTHDFAALTASDQAARLDLIKPKAGDPDFARKQALYETAVATGQKQAALRRDDPALAIQADKASAALWGGADASPAAAQAWAQDALKRQGALGIPDDQQRVLPQAVARGMVKAAQGKDGPARADALGELYQYAHRFGGQHEGRVMFEFQRAGLSSDEAAVLAATDGDPVVIGALTRAQARLPTVKLDKSDKDAIDGQVQRALDPLLSTYAGSADGQAYADALRRAVTTMATAAQADGAKPEDAARQASRWFTARYVLDPRTGWRAPSDIVARKSVPMVPTTTDEAVGRLNARPADLMKWKARPVDGATALKVGALRATRDLVLDGGKGLQPRGQESHLTAEQKQRRYADKIANEGKWENDGDDDDTLILTVPDPRGGRAPVLDVKGRPIRRTFEDLLVRAGKP